MRVSTSNFIPKPHTPFQWAAQMGPDDLARRHDLLRQRLKGAGVALSWEEPAHSLLEAVLSRGDRRLGAVILRAWKAGARFDAWNEISDRRLWDAAFREVGRPPRAQPSRGVPVVAHRRGSGRGVPAPGVGEGAAGRDDPRLPAGRLQRLWA